MKILLLQDFLRVGGTEKQTLFLARCFMEAGHATELLLFEPGGHLATPEMLEGLEVSFLKPFRTGLPLLAPGLGRAVAKRNPDVILCMGRTANCYAGFLQKCFPGITVVGTLRTGKLLFPLHHWSMGVVRAVLANSNWWKRRLLERNFPEQRIHVVHNAVLLERAPGEHRDKRAAMRERYHIREEECVFLNVATFRPGKRHRHLLQLLARLRKEEPELPWRLWLVGDGAEYRRCKRWAAENGLGTRVRFFHFQKDPLPFYAAADIAVSVSREDSLPNFLIEAQAAGLPVVAYDCRGVRETCQPGRTGKILPAGDKESFVAALRAFARDAEARHQWGSGAPAFARERFSRESQAMATLRFLEQVTRHS